MSDRPTSPALGPEIEVTPEMIEAGVEAYWDFHVPSCSSREDYQDEVLPKVYRAMEAARRATPSERPEASADALPLHP